MCLISKYPNFFLLCSFRAEKSRQNSWELSNLLQILEVVMTSKVIPLNLLSGGSLFGSEIEI